MSEEHKEWLSQLGITKEDIELLKREVDALVEKSDLKKRKLRWITRKIR